MRWAPLLIPACLLAQPSTPDPLVGSWLNQNPETPGITQITVRRNGTRIVAHVWAACHPTDCDWGEAEGGLWNGIPLVIWNQGFKSVRMQLVPQPNGGLLLAYHFEYHDGSGRAGQAHAEFFAREDSQAKVVDPAAKAVFQRVAETYRKLPQSRFEVDETVNRVAGKSESRTVKHMIVLYRPPDRLRIESTGAGEETITIYDGNSQWDVFPQSNEYRRIPQGKGAGPWLIGIYSLLDRSRATPRIVGQERFEGADCTIVERPMGRGVTDKVWIDNATHLIRKQTSDEPPTGRREIIFRVLRPSEPISPEAFSYDPAATQAKNRAQLAREAPSTLIGGPAPDFTLRDLDGREVRLRDLRGKVVLLDFWGTWCGYCREALPMIELLHRSLGGKGLVVYGIDAEDREIAREYLQNYGYTMPSLVDSNNKAANRYHVQAWPTTVLIDREGKVAYYAAGHEPEKLRDAIRALGSW